MANTLIFHAEKNVSSFCLQLLTFLQQKYQLENTSALTVNEFVINKLIKLTIL